ncbi:MAG: chitosanase [Chitinophagales bacterium]|nr:chitosanase [Chitinophagales bacterium]
MITLQQKNKIMQIVNVFETGTPKGKYNSISIYKDALINHQKVEQITYGRSQTTEFGNLKKLIELYIFNKGIYANEFKSYLSKIGQLPSLKNDKNFIPLLQKSAEEDSIMRQCQDDFFEQYYYLPAYNWFNKQQFQQALSLLVIYDSFIHSGSIPLFLRKRFPEKTPRYNGEEQQWITAYVKTRHQWLQHHRYKILQKTVYRTNCFLNQIKTNNWNLEQAVIANGITIR